MRKQAPILAGILFFASFASDAGTPTAIPVIHSIAIIPAADPKRYTFENATPPVGYPFQFWVNKADSRSKAQAFNDALYGKKAELGDELTQQVAAGLRSDGFTVEILKDIARPADDPDNIDYDQLTTTADAILHLGISEVGLYSGRVSTVYVPRVNTWGKLFVKGGDDIYQEEVDYGVDAKKGKSWAVQPDARYAYPSYHDVMTHIDEIRTSFDEGIHATAARMTQQICDTLKTAHPETVSSCSPFPTPTPTP
jgi:hypothetical protein